MLVLKKSRDNGCVSRKSSDPDRISIEDLDLFFKKHHLYILRKNSETPSM